MTEAERLEDLAARVEAAAGGDRELDERVHEALGWVYRKQTGLGMNGRTPGRWMWFAPPWNGKGRYILPSVFGSRNRIKYAAALRACAVEARK